MEDEDLEREWARLLSSWDDAAAHKRFLVLAEANGQLAFAGKRYRDVRESEPDKREIAIKQTEQILALAIAHMSRAERTEPQKGRGRLEWIAFGVSAALIAAVLWQFFRTI